MGASGLTSMPPGLYRGLVTGLESGECSARIEVRPGPGGCVVLDYEATSERDGLQHREHTVVAQGALYVAFSEGEGVSTFAETAAGVFVSSTPGPYALEIHGSCTDGVLTWVWLWAEAGETPREMSRAVCRIAAG